MTDTNGKTEKEDQKSKQKPSGKIISGNHRFDTSYCRLNRCGECGYRCYSDYPYK